jgi:aspartyl/asparaginyl-tRNA synthetase
MIYIKNLADHVDQDVTLKGWVYNYRSSKNLYFLELRDGTGICQCVVSKSDVSDEVWEAAESLRQESSLEVTGNIVEDERSIGGYEMHVSDIKIHQVAEDYPITPKHHGVDFLIENRTLWLRSQRQWAAMRVRNEIIYAIHTFFQERDFVQMDAPIFTGNAAEGTTTLFETEYFDEKAYLTQSGQLYGEAMAMAHGLIYTFGPTFRAEKSKTRRHLTEFWMIEPEMAYYDLEMDMDLAEDFIQAIVKQVLDRRSTPSPDPVVVDRVVEHAAEAAREDDARSPMPDRAARAPQRGWGRRVQTASAALVLLLVVGLGWWQLRPAGTTGETSAPQAATSGSEQVQEADAVPEWDDRDEVVRLHRRIEVLRTRSGSGGWDEGVQTVDTRP